MSKIESHQGLGARTDPAPEILPPPYDIQRRNTLFAELEYQRSLASATADEIARIEKELDALMEVGGPVDVSQPPERPKTTEEHAAFRVARKDAQRQKALDRLQGKRVKSTLYYAHSKSGDVDITLGDGSYLHIWANGEELEVEFRDSRGHTHG